jgi:hypothetical protein
LVTEHADTLFSGYGVQPFHGYKFFAAIGVIYMLGVIIIVIRGRLEFILRNPGMPPIHMPLFGFDNCN